MTSIIYASFIRFPAEKAHSLYVAKSCESFAKAGMRTTLLVPRRFGSVSEDYQTFHRISQPFSVQRLLCIDLVWLPLGKALAHKLGLVTFGVSVVFYLLRNRSAHLVFFTNDALVALLASFVTAKVVYEVHDYPDGLWWFYRWVGKRVYRIQTNNQQKVSLVVRDFQVDAQKVYAAYNGVAIDDFATAPEKAEARATLGLPPDQKIALYTGHLYSWKGVDTLAQAAEHLAGVLVLFVGGTKKDVERMKARYGQLANVRFLGHKPHQEMPLYQSAADVLVLPNTGKEDISRLHTSPMKLFEYMASGRPIVASDIPSIREILNDENAILVPPDEPTLLAQNISDVCVATDSYISYADTAARDVQAFSWERRAEHILKHIS